MPSTPRRAPARPAFIAVLTCALLVTTQVFVSSARPGVAAAAVKGGQSTTDQASSYGGDENALQDAAERAGRIGRSVALSLIGLALALAAVVLVFRRDFREAAGVSAVGLLAVLLATPSGLSLLRNTADLLFGAR
jgi:hypothetical protein